jgi:rhodanese-related sulfurtransferase
MLSGTTSRRAALGLLWISMALCGAGCSPLLQRSQPITFLIDVDTTESEALLTANRDSERFVVLDVRTPKEYSHGHLTGAINIDFRDEGFDRRVAELDRDRTYLVYCGAGVRSRCATKKMQELGFRRVFHMVEGSFGWIGAKLPMVG